MGSPVTSTMNKNLLALWQNHQAGADRKPIVCLEGSARSGKTYSALEYLVNVLAQQKLVATVFRHDAARHDQAALSDFKSIMLNNYLPLWLAGRYNGQLKMFTFANGSTITFAGTSDPSKLHGPARHIAFLNEITEIDAESFRQIRARTSMMMLMDWNPSISDHWVYSRVMKRHDCLHVHSTYKDNPFLSDHLVREIESLNPDIPSNVEQGTSDAYGWSVYGLGLKAVREGAIYREWEKVSRDRWPAASLFQRHGLGLDFGFAVSKTAIVECGLWNSRLYLRELCYQTNLITCRSHSQPHLPSVQGELERLRVPHSMPIVADSARPESIQELRAEGFNITACVKGKGSVLEGINLCKRFGLYIHEDSHNLVTELSQYSWNRKVDGTWLQEPEKKYDDLADAFRYYASEHLAGMAVSRNIGAVSRKARQLRRY